MITREWPLIPVYATTALFFIFDRALLGTLDSTLWTTFVLAWLFAVMVAAAFAVVRHSDCLAEIFGEPYGTLILTLAITVIEVMMIVAVMLIGLQESMLARDTMFSTISPMQRVALLGGACAKEERQPAGRQRIFAVRATRCPAWCCQFHSAPGGASAQEGF
jgi:Ca2+:H+ antiporter